MWNTSLVQCQRWSHPWPDSWQEIQHCKIAPIQPAGTARSAAVSWLNRECIQWNLPHPKLEIVRYKSGRSSIMYTPIPVNYCVLPESLLPVLDFFLFSFFLPWFSCVLSLETMQSLQKLFNPCRPIALKLGWFECSVVAAKIRGSLGVCYLASR